MSGHGFKQIDTGVEYGASKGGYTTKKKVSVWGAVLCAAACSTGSARPCRAGHA